MNALTQKLQVQEQELLQLKLQKATRKSKSESVTSESDVNTEQNNITHLPVKRGNDKDISKVKSAIKAFILAGTKPNLRQIATDTKVNYAKVRRLADRLTNEIVQELTQEQAANE